MLAFWAVVWRLERTLVETVLDRQFRPVFGLVIATLAAGSLFYWQVEGWSLLDSLYFSVVTLATVGYGDLSPTTKLSKSFTIAYIFVGAGTVAVFINAVAKNRREAPASSAA